jgi:hypothetical protein
MNSNPRFEPAEEEVKKAAYLRYLASGCVPGHDLENWISAREKIVSQHGSVDKNAERTAVATLHFPLNANASRGPFESFSSFENSN